ncbi:hypothetical protein D3C87_1360270 [compost metagenome]
MPGDDIENRTLVAIGFPPIALQQAPGPFEILHRQGSIETHLVGDAIKRLPRHAGRQVKLRQWPARREVEDGKTDDRDKQQKYEALPYPMEKKGQHDETPGRIVELASNHPRIAVRVPAASKPALHMDRA